MRMLSLFLLFIYSVSATSVTETFNTATFTPAKGAYAGAQTETSTISGSGQWKLSDQVLLATGDTGCNGACPRMKWTSTTTAYVSTMFAVTGINSLTVTHRSFGTDSSATWRFETSPDNSVWTVYGSSYTTSTTPKTVTTAITLTGAYYIRVHMLTGNRMNIDDLTFVYGTAPTTSAPTTSSPTTSAPTGCPRTLPTYPTTCPSSSTYPPVLNGGSMNCQGVADCGVLVLETGLGSGNYAHSYPVVHGLWPETGTYGTSQCIAPIVSSASPTVVYSCYVQDTGPQLTFEQHEWTSHGVCAGVCDAADFFNQVCGLAAAPLACMTGHSSSIQTAANAVQAAGYEIFNIDTTNSQLYLSACRDSSGIWHLTPQATFTTVCA